MSADLQGAVLIIAVWFAVSCLVAVAHHVVRGRVRRQGRVLVREAEQHAWGRR